MTVMQIFRDIKWVEQMETTKHEDVEALVSADLFLKMMEYELDMDDFHDVRKEVDGVLNGK
jgi:hypothetical protein